MPNVANRRSLPAILVLTFLFAHSLAAEVQIGRYSTVRALPTDAQRDVMATPISIRFDATVRTVGDAVAVILEEVGYTLSDPATADPQRQRLLSHALPKSHRQLGPLNVRAALSTLAGPGWQLVEDPSDRLVTFEQCKNLAY
ncbi:MAG: hypothetical protein OXG15_09990 [Gammaproteobacteria bacterium]|nr:hypothetical protein [Gammaproteobacteria bacterium]